MKDLNEAAERATDEDAFLDFLKVLRADWLANGRAWENLTFETFFEAAISWAEDSRNAPMCGPPSQNPWRRCAEILRAGAFYE